MKTKRKSSYKTRIKPKKQFRRKTFLPHTHVLQIESTGAARPYPISIVVEPTFKIIQKELQAELKFFFKKKKKTKDDLRILATQFKRTKSQLKTLIKKEKK